VTARGVAHLVVHGTSGSTSYKRFHPSDKKPLEAVDRDGPRRLRDDDNADEWLTGDDNSMSVQRTANVRTEHLYGGAVVQWGPRHVYRAGRTASDADAGRRRCSSGRVQCDGV